MQIPLHKSFLHTASSVSATPSPFHVVRIKTLHLCSPVVSFSQKQQADMSHTRTQSPTQPSVVPSIGTNRAGMCVQLFEIHTKQDKPALTTRRATQIPKHTWTTARQTQSLLEVSQIPAGLYQRLENLWSHRLQRCVPPVLGAVAGDLKRFGTARLIFATLN